MTDSSIWHLWEREVLFEITKTHQTRYSKIAFKRNNFCVDLKIHKMTFLHFVWLCREAGVIFQCMKHAGSSLPKVQCPPLTQIPWSSVSVAEILFHWKWLLDGCVLRYVPVLWKYWSVFDLKNARIGIYSHPRVNFCTLVTVLLNSKLNQKSQIYSSEILFFPRCSFLHLRGLILVINTIVHLIWEMGI